MGKIQLQATQRQAANDDGHLPDPGTVLAKATVRAATMLGLSGVALARVLGLSEPTVSRLLRGDRALVPGSKEGELAALLVRVYRSLDAVVGNDDGKRAAWIGSHNHALGGTPRELIQSAQGLVTTLNYLDAMRAVS
jgi:transcriptional regulator with XRE-family HTH domain